LLDTAGKEQHRGKLSFVGLALIDSIISHKTAWLKQRARCLSRTGISRLSFYQKTPPTVWH